MTLQDKAKKCKADVRESGKPGCGRGEGGGLVLLNQGARGAHKWEQWARVRT